MKIYTKTGDDGTTGLFGGMRLSKDHLRIESYGTIDELNAVIGITRARVAHPELDAYLEQIQNSLFTLGSDLATPLDETKISIQRLTADRTENLERIIDMIEERLTPLRHFILPGGHVSAAHLHHARTVCRRAERLCVQLAAREPVNPVAVPFLNRLSDLLFVLARYANHITGSAETEWKG